MADPVLVTCTADAWTKVATNVTAGKVKIVSNDPDQYLETYRDTGGTAPSGTPGEEAILVNGEVVTIGASAGIDVYLYARGAAGRVRVDL